MSSLDLRHRRQRQRGPKELRNLKRKQRAKAQRRAAKAILYSWAYGWPLSRAYSAEDLSAVPKWKEWTQAPADTIASMVFPDYKAKDTLSRRVKRAQWDRRRFE